MARTTTSPSTRALAAAAAALALAVVACDACSLSIGEPTVAFPPFSGAPSPTAYDAASVKQHLEVSANRRTFVRNAPRQSSFACVDSRDERPILGTPGGDMAEFMGGMSVYLNQTETAFSQDVVDDLMKEYLDSGKFKRSTKFYFHQGDSNMRAIYADVNAATGKKYVTLPDVLPAGEEAAWYDALSKGVRQGCGHIRLMIDQPNDYGLANSDVPRAAIKAFFKYWWTQPADSKARDRVLFEILQGPLDGKAVAIVSPTDDSDKSCLRRKQPAMATSYKGSQMFIYHAAAVGEYREKVVAPFFEKAAKSRGLKLDKAAFLEALNKLQETQLVATLKNLSPVKNLYIYSVPVTATKK